MPKKTKQQIIDELNSQIETLEDSVERLSELIDNEVADHKRTHDLLNATIAEQRGHITKQKIQIKDLLQLVEDMKVANTASVKGALLDALSIVAAASVHRGTSESPYEQE